jgi:hypothetical protein
LGPGCPQDHQNKNKASAGGRQKGRHRGVPPGATQLRKKVPAADPDFNPAGAVSYEQCVRPRSNDEIWRHEYGENYPGPVWQTHPDKFDIASDVKPLAEEAVFLTGYQLNGLCRRKDIDTLFYAGFMADICLLDVSGALREMANKFRYRCVALRDCTTARAAGLHYRI